MSVIDEVKEKSDIVEVIGRYTKLTKSGRTFRGLCPFHSEKKPSFFVYPEQQSWHCFGACSTGGDVFSFIMKKEGMDFGDALRFLADKSGITVTLRPESENEAKERERLFQINQAAAQYFNNLLLNFPGAGTARKYIEKRGLTAKSTADFQLGYSQDNWEALKQYLAGKGYTEGEMLTAGLVIKAETGRTHDRFRGMLMFPICDEKGRATGFGARVLDDSLPKYINSPQTPIFDKSGSLYGIHLAKAAVRQQDLAIMVEGYMDVIIAHQYGFYNVVAPMGIAITDKQINQIKKLTKNIILALDADEAGEEAMLRCVGYENSLGAEVKVMTLPEGKDPDEVIKEDKQVWQKLAASAIPVMDYTINITTGKMDMNTAKDKAAAVGKLLPIIAEVKDETRQDHYLNKLSVLAGTGYRSLETALARLKSSRKGSGTKTEAVKTIITSFRTSPIEEYVLALLLKYPQLKERAQELLPEYFENSENNAIFIVWQNNAEVTGLRDALDPVVCEHLDVLLKKDIPDAVMDKVEEKCSDCILRLREKYLRNLERKKAELLAMEAEAGTPGADLTRLEEQGMDVSVELKKVFDKKRKGI